MATPPPATKAYLLQSRMNAYFATCELELTDSILRCRVTSDTKWVAKKLGIPDLGVRLTAGEPVLAFEFQRDRMKLAWLKQFFKGGFKCSEPDSPAWLVSLINPAGALSLIDGFFERGVHEQWRAPQPEAQRR
jgi:hypothetical protein